MTPRISVLVITARKDRPYANRPDLRTCDPAVLSLLGQVDAPPFEIVVSDALDGKGREEHVYSPDGEIAQSACSSIQLVPGRNDWHRRGRPGFARQVNEAVRACRGEILVCVAEHCLCPPWLLRRVADLHAKGFWPNLLYLFDQTCASFTPAEACLDVATARRVPFRPYDGILGHRCCDPIFEHRWRYVLDEATVPLPWYGHHFGYFTLPRAVWNEVGGYDESFDGDHSSTDMDLGSRLEMAGYEDRLVLDRDCFVGEAIPAASEWSPGLGHPRESIVKCNYALLKQNRTLRRTRPGLPDEELIQREVCRAREDGTLQPEGALPPHPEMCPVRIECAARNDYYPLASRNPTLRPLVEQWREQCRRSR